MQKVNGHSARRRAHKKSRNGCRECKKRHIKCGEERPSCENCMRSLLDCDLGTSSPAGTPVTPDSLPQFHPYDPHGTGSDVRNGSTKHPLPGPSEGTSAKPQGIEASFPTLVDLELLHQYSTVTCLTLGRTHESQQVWQNYVPQLGLSQLFLLRGILAFAALHLAHLKPLQRAYYRDQAISHHGRAVHDFQNALKSISEANLEGLDAAFLFSTLLVVYNFAFQILDTPDTSSADAIDSIHDWVFLIRGCKVILDPFRDTLQGGALFPLLEERPQPVFLNGEHTFELRTMATTFATSGIDRDAVAAHAYGHAIQELEITFTRIREKTSRGEQPDVGSVLVWPVAVSQDFVNMLRLQKPEALVILAHYATVLKYRKDIWWLAGWDSYLISVVEKQLDESWKHWLEWPKEFCKKQIVR